MQRRKFIKNVAASSTAFSIVPSFVLGKTHIPPSDTLYVAVIGAGGRGVDLINKLDATGKVKFVALCDVDDRSASKTYNKYIKASKYTDFRKVYDTQLSEIDAIVVATPDHNHATVALPFMRAKKHTYIEKPLAHNIYETRLLTNVAKENGIITQMGNQGASSDGSRKSKEWIDSGIIGEVYKIDCWTNRPVWPQGIQIPSEKQTIPKGLDWDKWLGPATMRPYNDAYLPFKWRGWWDFGTGALGDMGCHIMETPFGVLDLGYPTEAEASCTTVWIGDFIEADYNASCPPSSVVRLKFKTKAHGNVALNWYDGGIMPDLPDELKGEEKIGGPDGGTLFYGTKGILVCDTYSINPRILPSSTMELFNAPKPYLKRIDGGQEGHQKNWVDCCLSGLETSSSFSKAGPLTEAVLMGNLAIRAYQYKVIKEGKKIGDWDPFSYPGRRKLLWDGENMRITNYEKANDWVKREYRKGWEVK